MTSALEATVETVVSHPLQSLVKFDRALSTAGASGGAAAERRVVAPQWIPVTQLVLLTMKVRTESF